MSEWYGVRPPAVPETTPAPPDRHDAVEPEPETSTKEPTADE
ncbi:MAG TPA: hypothetical protein VGL05_28500 [Kribbella sp.]